MAIFDLFSKRQKRLRGEDTDVYIYTSIPKQLRNQIIFIIDDAIGDYQRLPSYEIAPAYKLTHEILCREYGVFCLVEGTNNHKDAILKFINTDTHIESVLDAIEIIFRYIDIYARKQIYREIARPRIQPDDAIGELNGRFHEHAIGYQFESGSIIRLDSELIHEEIIKPALSILREAEFSGANEEFLNAHEHYRHGRHEECIVEVLKAFESTMKIICHKRKWKISDADAAKKLIATCLDHGLIPAFLQSEFTSLAALLESGAPTVRNKLGGHGQGATQREVPAYMARYALNTTASCILLLSEANAALK